MKKDALAQMHGIAAPVAENLHLDMPGPPEVFLDIDLVIAKGGLGLAARGAKGGFQLRLGPRQLHAAPAAAGRGLHDDRIARFLGHRKGGVEVMYTPLRSRNAGHAQLLHRVLGGDLVAHQADMFGGGADELDPVVLDSLNEIGVFRQETVAGVDRLGPGDLAGRDDRGHRQVGLPRGRRADTDRLVGHAHVHRVRVGGGVHRDGRHPHLARGPDDAQRDLAAVGDEDLGEHQAPPLTR